MITSSINDSLNYTTYTVFAIKIAQLIKIILLKGLNFSNVTTVYCILPTTNKNYMPKAIRTYFILSFTIF